MLTRMLGKSDIQASAIGLGAWEIGGWPWGGTDRAQAVRAVQVALDSGISLIDTAPVYGLGASEEIIGEAVRGRRNKAILATKCGLIWHTDCGEFAFEEMGRKVYRYLGAESIRYEIEQSLRRLHVDCIDLYQTHIPDRTTPIEETMQALEELKREGKIRAIGTSNVSLAQLREYESLGSVDSTQERYSMLDREIETELLPHCREQGISVLAYSPLAFGLLSGRIGPDRQFPPDDLRSSHPRFTVESRRAVQEMLREMDPIRERYGVTTAQLVIAWTAAQPGTSFVLCGARTAEHAMENAQAGRLALTAEEVGCINSIIAQHQRLAPAPA